MKWLFSTVVMSMVVMGGSLSAYARFYGTDNNEAVLRFDHQVELIQPTRPTDAEARAQIDRQLSFLFGSLESYGNVPAAPKKTHMLTNIRVDSAPQPGSQSILSLLRRQPRPLIWTIHYSYEGKLVVKKAPGSELALRLPVNPQTIFDDGSTHFGRKHPCTDPHYTSKGDFWYFWNPDNAGCPLQEGVDYVSFKAKLERSENTTQTYPEYERLAGADGTIRIDLLHGMNDGASGELDPTTSSDAFASGLPEIRQELLSRGYVSRRWSAAEIREQVKTSYKRAPYVEEFTREAKKGKIVIRFFFGPSALNTEDSAPFHWFVRDAIENASVMIYTGHSGLGGRLNIRYLEQQEGYKIAVNPDKYQIFFFNGCTTYAHYTDMYFKAKATAADPAGSKNLDILTNGISSSASVLRKEPPILHAIDEWMDETSTLSYQQILDSMVERDLMSVNGDEDNPTEIAPAAAVEAPAADPAPAKTPADAPAEASAETPIETPAPSVQ